MIYQLLDLSIISICPRLLVEVRRRLLEWIFRNPKAIDYFLKGKLGALSRSDI